MGVPKESDIRPGRPRGTDKVVHGGLHPLHVPVGQEYLQPAEVDQQPVRHMIRKFITFISTNIHYHCPHPVKNGILYLTYA